MKKVLLIILALAIIGGGAAWWVLADRPAAAPDVDPNAPNVVMPANYQPTDQEQAWIDSHTGEAGIWFKEFDGYRFVLITMGEKPTGGYVAEIGNVEAQGSEWVVDVVFEAPLSGDTVIQAITYPYTYVKIKADGNDITVRDISGDQPVEMDVTAE